VSGLIEICCNTLTKFFFLPTHFFAHPVAVGETLEEVKQLIAEAIIFHLEGLKEDGLTVPESVSICEYVDVA
jgi:hypothetical protein